MSRNIDDILKFRSDISPFLVHLTKNCDSVSASDVLKEIIKTKELQSDPKNFISSVWYAARDRAHKLDDDKKALLRPICFTESPINEIHCLLDISGRNVELEPYGLVFLKKNLAEKGVSPVIYINNHKNGNKDVFQEFFKLLSDNETKFEHLKKLIPLISHFGNKIEKTGQHDFTWEREWRYSESKFIFETKDVFLGLCPHNEIDEFEKCSAQFKFVDPYRNIKYYAEKISSLLNEKKINFSVF